MEQSSGYKRTVSLVIAFGVLAALIPFLRSFGWTGSGQLHTLMEVVSTILAAFVGVVAFVHYRTHKSNLFLFIATGFGATALLDGYHAVLTSQWFGTIWPTPLPTLIPWSWNASRFFLSALMFLSWLTWRREVTRGDDGKISEWKVYLTVVGMTLFTFAFFMLAPLPRAYYPELMFGRPEEFLAAAFFLAAFVGFVRDGRWKTDPFEYWLVLSLLVGFVCQAFFMSLSFSLFDGMFDTAHLLKSLSYICVLIGLLENVYARFSEIEQAKTHAEWANEEIRRRERLLEARAEELARSNKELDQFAYVASHDLKAPLRAIESTSRWIGEDAGDLLPEESKRHLEQLQQRVVRMEQFLDDLLQYSRAGREQLQPTSIETAALVNEIVEILSAADDIHVTVSPDMPAVVSPETPLRQVFQNLLSNAVKHSESDSPHIEVSAQKKGEFVEFSVTDNGPGIPEEYHERIFQMFQTLKPRDEVEGSGMGLAVVKKLIDRYGGTISVRSDADKGATFAFSWPQVVKG